jgi:hypothetical protein
MSFATTGTKKVVSAQCRVVFDPADGTIHHIHHVVTVEGARSSSQQEIEQRTRDMATGLGLDMTRLDVVSVEPHHLVRGTKYKVNTASRALVPVDTNHR